jgi:hypothetical protein
MLTRMGVLDRMRLLRDILFWAITILVIVLAPAYRDLLNGDFWRLLPETSIIQIIVAVTSLSILTLILGAITFGLDRELGKRERKDLGDELKRTVTEPLSSQFGQLAQAINGLSQEVQALKEAMRQ